MRKQVDTSPAAKRKRRRASAERSRKRNERERGDLAECVDQSCPACGYWFFAKPGQPCPSCKHEPPPVSA